RGEPARSQRQLPDLADEVLAEAVMLLALDEAEPGGLVEAPRRDQHVVGPEPEPAVAAAPRETDAFGDEALADAEAARLGRDDEEAELGDALRLFHDEDRADDLALAFGDPAALALRIEMAEELGGDLGDQRLELLVPAKLLGVEAAVERHHPAHV